VVKLSFLIFANFKNQRIQSLSNPTDRPKLLGHIRTLMEIVRMSEDLLRLLEADAAERVRPQPLALTRVEVEAHMYNSYTIISGSSTSEIRSAVAGSVA
jgi:hypothetical protein